MISDDERMLRAWGAGDRSAADALLARHFMAVFSFFRTKTDLSTAEDLTQRTFMACLEGHTRFREGGNVRAYLLGIARNELRQQIGRHARSSSVDLSAISARDLRTSPSGHVARGEEQQVLLEALRRIPLEFQITLELFYWEELTGPEIAEVLGVAVGTVRSRISRAKDHLEREIAKVAQSERIERSTMDHLDRWVRSIRDQLGAGGRRPVSPEVVTKGESADG